MLSLAHLGTLAIAAVALSFVFTWVCIHLSRNFGLAAVPRFDRWHNVPTPNTGGVAIVLSCAIVCATAGLGRYTAIAWAAAGMALLGFIDDRIQLSPIVKFAGQSLAVIVVIASGVVARLTSSHVLNVCLTFLWVAGLTNAFNLIDNMDGLCAGVTVIICGFRFCSAFQSGDVAAAAILAVMAGAFSGFLILNYKPAKIFMGDAGSMLAGFTLASLAIATPVPQTRVFLSAILYPALTFLYPIFDTVFVSLLRKLAGRKISVGGRDHSSHRLASLGLKEQKVVWLLWLLTALGAAGGLLTYSMPISVWAIAFFLVLATTIFGMFLADLPGYEIPHTALTSASWVRKYVPTLRAGMILLVDTLIAGVSLLVAFLLKWEENFSGKHLAELLIMLPIVMGSQAASCLATRIFHLGWRWIGIQEILAVGRAVLLSSGTALLVSLALGTHGYSRGIVLSYSLVTFSAMAGYRSLLGLLWRLLGSPQNGRRAALLGAVQPAELVILVLQRSKELNASPVLVFDLDRSYSATRIHGIPIASADSNAIITLRESLIDILIIAGQDTTFPASQQAVVDACNTLGIPVFHFEWHLSPLPISELEPYSWRSSLPSSAAASV